MNKKSNKVYIATSIDGYIADIDGGIEWLDEIPGIDQTDTGYYAFMDEIDALVMSRVTFEKVCSFDIEWPYQKPVFVLSNTLNTLPEKLIGKTHLVKGPLKDVLKQVHQNGYHRLYIDGGKTITSFLQEDLIDEMIISIIPFVLGNGIPLFSNLSNRLTFECVDTKIFGNIIIQNHFKRKRKTHD